MIYEIETIAGLPADRRRSVPLESERRNVQVGTLVRLLVFVNGEHYIAPFVEVVEILGTEYVGLVGGYINSPDWHPYGTRVHFGPDNIISL